MRDWDERAELLRGGYCPRKVEVYYILLACASYLTILGMEKANSLYCFSNLLDASVYHLILEILRSADSAPANRFDILLTENRYYAGSCYQNWISRSLDDLLHQGLIVIRIFIFRMLLFRDLIFRMVIFQDLIFQDLIFQDLIFRILIFRILIFRDLILRRLIVIFHHFP